MIRAFRDWLSRPFASAAPAIRTVRNNRSYADQDVCLFVSHTFQGLVKPYVAYHIAALKKCGFRIVLILNSNDHGSAPSPECYDTLVLRDNIGFDFGAWADALRRMPTLWNARRLLFVNDSIFGPVFPLAHLMRDLISRKSDCIGLTESLQVKRHFQSFFFLMNRDCLRSPLARQFWAEVQNHADKQEVINQYELSLYEKCLAWGLSCEVMFPCESTHSDRPLNPTLAQWRRLIERGFPYLKVELLRDNPNEDDITGWRDVVADPILLDAIDAHLGQHRERRTGVSLAALNESTRP